LLDQLEGAAEHVSQRVNLAVVGKAPLRRILAFADERGWRRLSLLSSARTNNTRASIERALAIDEAAYGPDHLQVTKDLVNLGLVQRDLRELREARASFERALAIFQAAAYDPDDSAIGWALFNLGAVQLRLRKPRAGLASIQRALVVFQAAYGPDRREVMKALVKLGIVQRRKIITNYFISLAFKRQRKVKPGKWQFDPDSGYPK